MSNEQHSKTLCSCHTSIGFADRIPEGQCATGLQLPHAKKCIEGVMVSSLSGSCGQVSCRVIMSSRISASNKEEGVGRLHFMCPCPCLRQWQNKSWQSFRRQHCYYEGIVDPCSVQMCLGHHSQGCYSCAELRKIQACYFAL